MNRSFVLISSLLAFTISAPLQATDAGPVSTRDPIRPVSQCLRIDRVSDWKVIDDRHLLVKSLGNRFFDIELSNRCIDLKGSSYVGFRDGIQPIVRGSHPPRSAPAQNPVTSDGRICGDIGDAVIPEAGSPSATSQPPCLIARIQPADEETWNRAATSR